MIKFTVVDKQFGKPFITYKAVNTINNEVIKEGKCTGFHTIGNMYAGFVNEYGRENVRMLTR